MRVTILKLAGLCLAVALPAWGQDAPSTDFTFKRVTVPTGSGPRITVQIDPAEAAAWMEGPAQPVAPSVPAVAALPAQPGQWDWFWEHASPALADAGPANVTRALTALDTARDVPAPRAQVLHDIAAAHGAEILKATIGTPVSPALVLALISVESSGQADAVSGAGAQGLMQLIPATADRFGVQDAMMPDQNIAGGVKYLAWLLNHFDGDPIMALAGYNAGENAVTGNGGVPPYAETRAYVPKVLNAWRVARGLCLTPPELISDGCVFAAMGTRTNG